MNVEITVEYSSELLKLATKRLWIRWIGWSGFASFGFLVVVFVSLIISGNRDWEIGAYATLLVLAFALGSGGYFICRRRGKMPGPCRPRGWPVIVFVFR